LAAFSTRARPFPDLFYPSLFNFGNKNNEPETRTGQEGWLAPEGVGLERLSGGGKPLS
jgi:hypothetical protein